MQSVGGERGLFFLGAVGNDAAQAGAGLEQRRGLAQHHLVILLLVGIGVVAVKELQHLALGDAVGSVRENLHDAHAVDIHHHLEGA